MHDPITPATSTRPASRWRGVACGFLVVTGVLVVLLLATGIALLYRHPSVRFGEVLLMNIHIFGSGFLAALLLLGAARQLWQHRRRGAVLGALGFVALLPVYGGLAGPAHHAIPIVAIIGIVLMIAAWKELAYRRREIPSSTRPT